MQTTTDEPKRASDDGMVRRPAWPRGRYHSFGHALARGAVLARAAMSAFWCRFNVAWGQELPSLLGKVSEERHQLRCL